MDSDTSHTKSVLLTAKYAYISPGIILIIIQGRLIALTPKI